jgi:hypothetical protein
MAPNKRRIWIDTRPLFDPQAEGIDPANEQRATAEIRRRLRDLAAVHAHLRAVAETALPLLDNRVHIPEVAEALGLPPAFPRAPRRGRKPWKIRPGSDAEIAAGLIEAAGRRGISEADLLQALEERGRLAAARYPARALRWTLPNLQKRTQAIIRDPKTGRWKALNSLDHFRAQASPKGSQA